MLKVIHECYVKPISYTQSSCRIIVGKQSVSNFSNSESSSTHYKKNASANHEEPDKIAQTSRLLCTQVTTVFSILNSTNINSAENTLLKNGGLPDTRCICKILRNSKSNAACFVIFCSAATTKLAHLPMLKNKITHYMTASQSLHNTTDASQHHKPFSVIIQFIMLVSGPKA